VELLRALFGQRPSGDRRRVFAVIAAIVVAAVVGLSALGKPASVRPAPVAAAGTPDVLVTPTVTSVPTVTATATPAGARIGPVRAVRRAARTFLGGYVAWAYGRGSATQIQAVAPALRRNLAAGTLKARPNVAKAHPRITGPLKRDVQISGNLARATAFVDDDVQPAYPITVTLSLTDGHWLAEAVQ
jgi:hypothetical protein